MLAKLGEVLFTAKDVPLHSLRRESSGRWVTHETLKGDTILSFSGSHPRKIQLAGTLLSSFHGGLSKIEALHEMVEKGSVVPFTASKDDSGTYLGLWAVTSISDERTLFDYQGCAKKIEFHLELLQVSHA